MIPVDLSILKNPTLFCKAVALPGKMLTSPRQSSQSPEANMLLGWVWVGLGLRSHDVICFARFRFLFSLLPTASGCKGFGWFWS